MTAITRICPLREIRVFYFPAKNPFSTEVKNVKAVVEYESD